MLEDYLIRQKFKSTKITLGQVQRRIRGNYHNIQSKLTMLASNMRYGDDDEYLNLMDELGGLVSYNSYDLTFSMR